MKISIIVPVYNAEKYLKRCIKSITAQTFAEFELILVNDGSSDRSALICMKFAEKDERLKIISKEKSEGAGPARNSGIDAATGRYLMFLDADDYIEPTMLETLYNTMTKSELDLAICGFSSFAPGYTERCGYKAKSVHGTDKVRKFFVKNFPEGVVGYLWNKIYKAQIIKENNLRFPDMRRLQDGVFNIDYFAHVNSFEIISQELYHYMLNPQEGLFKKCPKDYYELIRRFSEGFYNTATSFGIDSALNKGKISIFFLNELTNCFENANSAEWDMNRKARHQYYTRLLRDGFLRDNLRKKEAVKSQIGRYRRILLALFAKRHFSAMDFVIWLKVTLKKGSKKLFYKLKRG